MKSALRRVAVAGILAPALALGVPAVAMADSYFASESTSAGPKGASSSTVHAYASNGHGHGHHGKARHGDRGGGDGGSFYYSTGDAAGPKGASSWTTVAGAR